MARSAEKRSLIVATVSGLVMVASTALAVVCDQGEKGLTYLEKNVEDIPLSYDLGYFAGVILAVVMGGLVVIFLREWVKDKRHTRREQVMIGPVLLEQLASEWPKPTEPYLPDTPAYLRPKPLSGKPVVVRGGLPRGY